jgi:hypothetical protein
MLFLTRKKKHVSMPQCIRVCLMVSLHSGRRFAERERESESEREREREREREIKCVCE